MNVAVEDGLAGRGAVVQADIEAVWVVALGKTISDVIDELPNTGLLFGAEVKVGGDVASREDERVARRGWECVEDGDAKRCLKKELASVVAERTRFHGRLRYHSAAQEILRRATTGGAQSAGILFAAITAYIAQYCWCFRFCPIRCG